MRVKTERYEQIARKGVRWAIESALEIQARGLSPAKISDCIEQIIGYALTDIECEEWTKHNERKTTKYVEAEIRAWKAGWRTI